MIWCILAYVILSILTFGMEFAYNQREFASVARSQWREDIAMALFMALICPIGFPVILLMTGFAKHGLLYWPEHRMQGGRR